MKAILLSFLLYLILLFSSLINAIQLVHMRCFMLLKCIRNCRTKEIDFSKRFRKLPSHLSIIVTEKLLCRLNYVSCLITWARLCGVKLVSVYDQQGKPNINVV